MTSKKKKISKIEYNSDILDLCKVLLKRVIAIKKSNLIYYTRNSQISQNDIHILFSKSKQNSQKKI